MKSKKPTLSWGRCPDCGAAVEVEIRKPQPARIRPHGCPARACEHPGCQGVALQDRMVRGDDGTWHCPPHALIVAARSLVSLYHAEGEADWTAIAELIGETLPEILQRLDEGEPGTARAPC